jgi:hypothetical protein
VTGVTKIGCALGVVRLESMGLALLSAALWALATVASAQSIATLKGRVIDSSGAIVRGASITLREEDTGVERRATTDAAGNYQFAFLTVGTYRIQVESPGLRTEVLPRLVVEVGRTIVQDVQLQVGGVAASIDVGSEIPAIERSMALGQIIDRRTVQDIPLNGRQLLQLALLVPGSITPPQNGFLTAPSRAQGSQGLNTAGQREDTANFQVNGVTLNDQINNILVFQPPLDSVQEFRIDNSSPTAEQGRNSGASINIVTRSGTNQWHGGAIEFFRDQSLDARNVFSVREGPFERHQFGGHLGGPIVRNRTFFFATYEGLRQDQGLPTNSVVPSDAQRAAATHPVVRNLLALVPRATSTDDRGVARFVGSADAPVDVDRWAGDVTHSFGPNDRVHGFYAFQRDWRREPLELGNTLPGFGDVRLGHRQLFTIEHTRTMGSRFVNQARVGFNRIAFEAGHGATVLPGDYGLDTGSHPTEGLPVFNVAGAFNFGGPPNLPQGRTDTTIVVSDTVSYAAGRHAIRFGGEYRKFVYDAWMFDPGTFNFPSVGAFGTGVANSFSRFLGDRAAYVTQHSIGGFVQDSIRPHPALTLDLGLRYEWNVTPAERDDRFVVFDASTASLLQVGVDKADVYRQNNDNLEPRVGVVWDASRDGRTLIRAAYTLTVEQPMVNAVSNLTANPPMGTPLAVTGAVPVDTAYALAGAQGLAPFTIDPEYENAIAHGWNINVQREIARDAAVTVGYIGARGGQLRLTRNVNQPVDGRRPFTNVAAASPILPGTPLGNITQIESSGESRYHALWASMTRRLSRGLQFGASYTWSRSRDTNSLSSPPTVVTVQNGYDVMDSWGPSDFDARHRFVVRAVYDLPFDSPVVRGWQIAAILQAQSGSPLNVVTSNSTLTGVANTVRPDATGPIRIIGDVNQWFDTSVFVPVNGFGNLARNAVVGPRFDTLDVSVSKLVSLTAGVRMQLQADVFNVFNHANLGQPGRIVGSPNFGVITNTRFPPGDSGSSRQVQLAVKVLF